MKIVDQNTVQWSQMTFLQNLFHKKSKLMRTQSVKDVMKEQVKEISTPTNASLSQTYAKLESEKMITEALLYEDTCIPEEEVVISLRVIQVPRTPLRSAKSAFSSP
jgi:hypothetical protein